VSRPWAAWYTTVRPIVTYVTISLRRGYDGATCC
jgi:hypothetical protein